MQHFVIRAGSRLRRRLGLILAVAVLLVAVFLLLQPRRWFGRPDLQLVALDANGFFQDSISLPREWADTVYRGAYGARARVPLLLAVRNIGTAEGRARALHLSLPARYRLELGDGRELPYQLEPGNPLIRYTINGPFPPVQPGRLPTVLPSMDTLWLEPVVPQLYCISVGDSIPEFVPAATPDPRLLSHVNIFYSFDANTPGRQAGLLEVRLDPSLVERPPATPPPSFPTLLKEPAWPLPAVGPLRRIGFARARCGPPESPMEVQSTIWQTEDGGRLIVLAYGGKPRKYLFDLNRDSLVDLEMWDASGKGRFDAEREARYPIPSFLLPPPGPPPFNPAVFADLTPDSLSRLFAFRGAGTYRPQSSPDQHSPSGPFAEAGSYSPRGPQPAARTGGSVFGATATATSGAAGEPGAARPAGGAGLAAPAPPARRPHLLGRPVQLPRPDTGR